MTFTPFFFCFVLLFIFVVLMIFTHLFFVLVFYLHLLPVSVSSALYSSIQSGVRGSARGIFSIQ
jgi:hypothetical protein